MAVLLIICSMPAAVLAAEDSGTCGTNLSWSLNSGTLTINAKTAGEYASMDDYEYGTAPWYEMPSGSVKEKIIATAENEMDYHEKKNGSSLYDKYENAGENNYTKFTYELTKYANASNIYYPSAWCDAFFDWCMYKTFGSSKAQELICGVFNGYTPSSSSYYKKMNQWYTTDTIPQVGDQIFFKNSVRICHTGIVIKVTNNRVYTLEGNANDAVRKRSYAFGDDYLAGYGRPAYDATPVNMADSIRSVTVQNTAKIGNYAFAYCSQLSSISLPGSLNSIGDYAFYNDTSLTAVNLPGGLTSIGDAAFQNTGLKTITLPGSLKRIGMGAFHGCAGLTEVAIPESISRIEEYTFMGCENLRSIYIPDSVTSLALSAFGGCTSLTEINYEGTEEQWNAIVKPAEDNSNGKYDITAKINFNVPTVAGFHDVPSNKWYADDVQYVYDNGLMNGTSSATFEPLTGTNRGMVVTVLYRLAGSPELPDLSNLDQDLPEGMELDPEDEDAGAGLVDDTGSGETGTAVPGEDSSETVLRGLPEFTDVDSSAYYAKAVNWAYVYGIVSGYSDEVFGPTNLITREQLATILYNYAEFWEKLDVTNKADLSAYKDSDRISAWAEEGMRWCNAAGIINGMSATELNPSGTANRSQVAAILHRYCEFVKAKN